MPYVAGIASENSISIIAPTATAETPLPSAMILADVAPSMNPTSAGPPRESGGFVAAWQCAAVPAKRTSWGGPVRICTPELEPHCEIWSMMRRNPPFVSLAATYSS